MARKETVELIDDLDGSSGDDVVTVTFGLDGVTYEIDLSKSNAERLRGAVAPYAGAGRWMRGRRLQRQHAAAALVLPLRPKTRHEDNASQIREWAQANGIELAARGRIPAHVAESYRQAQREAKPARKAPAPAFSAKSVTSTAKRVPAKRGPAKR